MIEISSAFVLALCLSCKNQNLRTADRFSVLYPSRYRRIIAHTRGLLSCDVLQQWAKSDTQRRGLPSSDHRELHRCTCTRARVRSFIELAWLLAVNEHSKSSFKEVTRRKRPNGNVRMFVYGQSYNVRTARYCASRACSAIVLRETRKRRLHRVHTVGTPSVRRGLSVRISVCVSRFPHSIAMYGTRDDVLSRPLRPLAVAARSPYRLLRWRAGTDIVAVDNEKHNRQEDDNDDD